jgi:hypothetical protein
MGHRTNQTKSVGRQPDSYSRNEIKFDRKKPQSGFTSKGFEVKDAKPAQIFDINRRQAPMLNFGTTNGKFALGLLTISVMSSLMTPAMGQTTATCTPPSSTYLNADPMCSSVRFPYGINEFYVFYQAAADVVATAATQQLLCTVWRVDPPWGYNGYPILSSSAATDVSPYKWRRPPGDAFGGIQAFPSDCDAYRTACSDYATCLSTLPTSAPPTTEPTTQPPTEETPPIITSSTIIEPSSSSVASEPSSHAIEPSTTQEPILPTQQADPTRPPTQQNDATGGAIGGGVVAVLAGSAALVGASAYATVKCKKQKKASFYENPVTLKELEATPPITLVA